MHKQDAQARTPSVHAAREHFEVLNSPADGADQIVTGDDAHIEQDQDFDLEDGRVETEPASHQVDAEPA